MTINEITNQLYGMSSGQINGRKYTKKALTSEMKEAMNKPDAIYTGKILLNDGEWRFMVNSILCSGHMEYDYYIPDTREQEASMIRIYHLGIA